MKCRALNTEGVGEFEPRVTPWDKVEVARATLKVSAKPKRYLAGTRGVRWPTLSGFQYLSCHLPRVLPWAQNRQHLRCSMLLRLSAELDVLTYYFWPLRCDCLVCSFQNEVRSPDDKNLAPVGVDPTVRRSTNR